MKRYLFYLLFLLLSGSCQLDSKQESAASPVVREITSPCRQGGEGRLFTSARGELYLSWVEYLNDTTDALRFARLEEGEWTAPQEIARGNDWFVNWADFPALVVDKNDEQRLTAHWLQKSAVGTYDYDVHLTQSQDGGQTWSPSFLPHRDSIAAEHGFVSMLPLADQQTLVTWLDGRNTKGETPVDNDGHGHSGAMTLRAALVDQNGQLSEEVELDDRVCDCCPTSAAMTSNGPIVAYRNRSAAEVRDIYVVRQVNGQWQEPTAVHNDSWTIAGCPVNGPVVKARGEQVAVAWFTAAEGQSEVKLAFSEDGGANFQPPIAIGHGLPMGRVGLVFEQEEEVLISWLEQADSIAELRLARITTRGEKLEELKLAALEASRQSGVPVISMREQELFFAYTRVDRLPRVVTGKVSWDSSRRK